MSKWIQVQRGLTIEPCRFWVFRIAPKTKRTEKTEATGGPPRSSSLDLTRRSGCSPAVPYPPARHSQCSMRMTFVDVRRGKRFRHAFEKMASNGRNFVFRLKTSFLGHRISLDFRDWKTLAPKINFQLRQYRRTRIGLRTDD